MNTYAPVVPIAGTAPRLDLSYKIAAQAANVGIIGLGYVGLPLALMFSDQGFPVVGFDLDMLRVSALHDRKSYLHTVPDDWVRSARGSGFIPSTDMGLLSDMDVIVICVPTPINERCEPDLGPLIASAKQIAPHLREGQLIVLQSTSFPGTTDEILIPILEANHRGLRACREDPVKEGEFFVAFSPEREDPGNKEFTRSAVPKVVGGLTQATGRLACSFFAGVYSRVFPVSSPGTAEMAKLLENSYRFVNIGLVNELKVLCEKMQIDVWEVIEAASTKPFGFHAFFPGPGIGGHCIPVDPLYLSWKAKQYNMTMRSIEVAHQINSSMPQHVVESIRDSLNACGKPVNGSHVLLLGAAYKKNIDDVRESPFLKIAKQLSLGGCIVRYHDPYVPSVRISADLEYKSVPLSNLEKYDAVVLLTDHSTFECEKLARESKLFIDTRGVTRAIQSPNIIRC